VHVAYGRGSVLVRQADEIPSVGGNFIIDNALYSIAFGTIAWKSATKAEFTRVKLYSLLTHTLDALRLSILISWGKRARQA